MDQEDATKVLHRISDTFQKNSVGVILYEPIGGHDAFGKMMIRNLAVSINLKIISDKVKIRGINLKTLSAYPTLQEESLRLKDSGFVSGQDAVDVNFAHNHWMGQEELSRIAKLELLDEMEEWRLLASHYYIAWGWRTADAANGKNGDVFEGWGQIKNTTV